jgi:Phospholipase_D-nuclease N-terminal
VRHLGYSPVEKEGDNTQMSWWEFFIVMAVVLPIMALWLGCIIDAIMRPDIGGWAKALWVLFILFVPLIGSIVYIVTRPAIIVPQPGLGSYSQPTTSSNVPPVSNADPRYVRQ